MAIPARILSTYSTAITADSLQTSVDSEPVARGCPILLRSNWVGRKMFGESRARGLFTPAFQTRPGNLITSVNIGGLQHSAASHFLQADFSGTSRPESAKHHRLQTSRRIGHSQTPSPCRAMAATSTHPAPLTSSPHFTYNPANGDLLFEVIASNRPTIANGSGNGYVEADNSGAVTARNWCLGASDCANRIVGRVGPVTTFSTATAVPGPEPWPCWDRRSLD
jgi:hypothetical protein